MRKALTKTSGDADAESPIGRGAFRLPRLTNEPRASRALAPQFAQLLRWAGLFPERAISKWPRGVTVSTLDSESSDRGSNPREASLLIQAAEHVLPEQRH